MGENALRFSTPLPARREGPGVGASPEDGRPYIDIPTPAPPCVQGGGRS